MTILVRRIICTIRCVNQICGLPSFITKRKAKTDIRNTERIEGQKEKEDMREREREREGGERERVS